MPIQENNPAGRASKAETLTADRTTGPRDHGRIIFVGAVDLDLTLHTPTVDQGGFWITCVVVVPSVSTGFTVTGAINGGSTSAVNTAATDAQGDSVTAYWTGTEWIGTFAGTWSVT